jgi:drug/metabolite transporter (DMT)-like permease
VVLALLSAVSYGASDFLGGLGSRRASFLRVAVVAQLGAAVSLLVAAPLVGGHRTLEGLVWGALGGLGSGTGSVALYRGLGRGQMSVVGPISGVGTAVIPAVAGLALGERPSAVTLAGVVVMVPAVYLIARTQDPPHVAAGRGGWDGGFHAGVLDGALAGVGFGLFFLALSQAGPGDGLWPSAASSVLSAVLVCGLVGVRRVRWPSAPGTAPPATAPPDAGGPDRTVIADRPAPLGGPVTLTAFGAGVAAGAASALYLLATRQGLLVVVAVLAALYPAVTVLLARIILRERSSRGQVAGLVLAAGAVVAITAG